MPPTPAETVPQKPDLSEFELPNSDPEPMQIPKKAPAGAAGVRPGGGDSSPPAAPKHSPRTLRLAAHLGITENEISSLSREDLLHEVQAAQAEQRQMEMEVNRGRSADIRNAPTPKPAEVEPPLLDATIAEWEEDDAEHPGQKIKRTLKDDDLAPPLVKLLKNYKKELAEVKAKLEAKDQQAAALTKVQQIDAGFAALGEGYEKLFGKGNGLDMPKGDPHLMRRRAILHSLQYDPPEETLNIKDAIAKRVKELHGEGAESTAEPDPYAIDPTGSRRTPPPAPIPPPRRTPPKDEATGRFTQEEWVEGALAKPTSRKSQDLPRGRERALQAVKAKLREQNIARNGDGGHVEEWDELPDA